MVMQQADYSKIAGVYDRGRPLSDQNVALWLGLVAGRVEVRPDSHLLDLGCGTGRFSLPMAERFGCRVTGADASEAMLAMARQKDPRHLVTWEQQEATRLTYPDGHFDAVFMSHLLHHIAVPVRVLHECHRVLRPGGVVLVRYGTMEQIQRDVVHAFFPETVSLDRDRHQFLDRLTDALGAVGFVTVESKEVTQQTYESAAVHVEAIRTRGTSVLTLIPERAFQEGLQRLEEYVRKHPDDPWLLTDRMTFTSARKPRKCP